MKTVRFFFDFLSPYSYLASQLIEREEAYRDLPLEYCPVIFGSMLSKLGTKGPGEIPSRRRIGLEDIILLCQMYGLELKGPPSHPFNTIYALRSVCDVEDQALRARLVPMYFRKAWAEGADLEDMDVLKGCLAELGIDQDPSDAASKRENRAALKANTKEVLAAGAWGVPTFLVDDLIFFGHDRLPALKAYLDGDVKKDEPLLADMLARPQPGRIT